MTGVRLYWARNDGMSGHVWLAASDQAALAQEMVLQGMGDFPVERFLRGEPMHVTVTEIERALAAAGDEPIGVDPGLWRDWLAFLAGATRSGGLLLR